MSYISTICPHCGSSIMIDDEREDSFCSCCGKKLTIQEATKQKEVSVENYLKLAEAAYEAQNGKEEFEYATKALELDVNCAEAWYRKLVSIGHLAVFPTETRIKEVLAYGRKAIECDPKTANDVYGFYLQYAREMLRIMTMLLNENRMFEEVIEREQDIIELRNAIPDAEIAKDEDVIRFDIEVAQCWVLYEDAVEKAWREVKQNGYFGENKRAKYKEFIPVILKGIPERVVQSTFGLEIQNKYSVPTKQQEQKFTFPGCLLFILIALLSGYLFHQCIH